MSGRWVELIQDDKGRLDEQPVLMIAFAVSLIGLEIFSVVARGAHFDAITFGSAAAMFVVGAPTGLGLRAKLRRGSDGDGS